MSQQKAKFWWGILYPENMVANWENDIADIIQLPFAYCIHDKDLLNDGDETRKVHVHLMIMWNNTTTYKHALSVFQELNDPGRSCVNAIKAIISPRRAWDYLIHDTEEARKKGKYQYTKEERIEGNNFDIGAYEQLSTEEKAEMRRTLSKLCLEKGFTSYAAFYRYVMMKSTDKELENVVVSYQGHFDKLCKGNYHQEEKKKKLVKKEVEQEDKKADIAERLEDEK